VCEAEESPLLDAVAREWLVKTQQAGKDLAGAVVNFRLWGLVMALQLLVVLSHVYTWSVNTISNPQPCRGSLYYVTIYIHYNLENTS
jgi:hypothetical protein